MNIAIGSDHAGYASKEGILKYLKLDNHTITDVGTYSTDSVDYPDIAQKVATLVSQKKVDRGILLCGTGIGVSIAANKFSGIR
ncbi:MAG: RpiB/LacA/LacB family sugar-phosphate isomerase, partial [Fidelibacterota bacterium]